MTAQTNYASESAVRRLRRWGAKYFAGDPDYLPGEVRGDLRVLRRGPHESRSQHYAQREADDELLRRERAYIENWRSKTGNTKEKSLIGLALSGGGIRSATFSLGVLQALARHDVLKYIDYISTVSGGGYIGSGLTWWLAGKTGSKETYGVDGATFPYGVADPARPDEHPTPTLTHLRNNASYLVPGGGHQLPIWGRDPHPSSFT
jgi:hypothetical protein